MQRTTALREALPLIQSFDAEMKMKRMILALAVIALASPGCAVRDPKPGPTGFRNLSPPGKHAPISPPFESASAPPAMLGSGAGTNRLTTTNALARVSVGDSSTEVHKHLGGGNDIEIVITGTEPDYQRLHYWCSDGTVIVTIKGDTVTDISHTEKPEASNKPSAPYR